MKKTRTVWTDDQTNKLIEMYSEFSGWQIAEELGKTKPAVMMRANKLGLKKPANFKVTRSPEDNMNKSKRMTGKKVGPFSYEHRKKISNSQPNKGKNKRSTENNLARRSVEYRMWRKAVFERDDYTCQHCNARGVELNADHIKPFAVFKELRYELTNGRTLCVECHRKTPTWGKRYDILKPTYGTTF